MRFVWCLLKGFANLHMRLVWRANSFHLHYYMLLYEICLFTLILFSVLVSRKFQSFVCLPLYSFHCPCSTSRGRSRKDSLQRGWFRRGGIAFYTLIGDTYSKNHPQCRHLYVNTSVVSLPVYPYILSCCLSEKFFFICTDTLLSFGRSSGRSALVDIRLNYLPREVILCYAKLVWRYVLVTGV